MNYDIPVYLEQPEIASKPTGHDRRRAANCLPSAFFLYAGELRAIIGAAVCTRVFRVDDNVGAAFWEFTRAVKLLQPVAVDSRNTNYRGQVFILKSGGEAAARLSVSVPGGYIASHYPEFEQRRFRCFNLKARDCDKLFSSPSVVEFVETKSSWVVSAGVVAETVPALPAIAPAVDDTGFEEGDPNPTDEAAPHGVAGDALPDSSAVQSRLRGLFRESRGAVPRLYSASGMLSFLELASNLKPSAEMKNVLSASAALFFGDAGKSLVVDLQQGKVPLPSLQTMKVARLRLDLLSMVWEQHLFLRFDLLIYQLVDSSPQLGYNFLVVLEDVVRIPQELTRDLLRRAAFILNDNWVPIVQALSSLGLGKASAVSKTVCTSNLLIMSVATVSDFHRKRECYRGVTTDHGVEHKIGDMPIGVTGISDDKDVGDPTGFLYPWLISIIDMLHTLWGAYETAFKNNPLCAKFLEILHILTAFTSDTQIMRKFRATCLTEDVEAQKLFRSKAKIHIDWRWESMCAALDYHVPCHRKFRELYDQAKLCESDSDSKILTSATIKSVAKAFTMMTALEFEFVAEFYRVLGKVVAKYAGELEIRDCHKEIWTPDTSWKKRRRLLKDILDNVTCIWQGRRMAWFIAVGYFELLQDLRLAGSDRLHALLAEVPTWPLIQSHVFVVRRSYYYHS